MIAVVYGFKCTQMYKRYDLCKILTYCMFHDDHNLSDLEIKDGWNQYAIQ